MSYYNRRKMSKRGEGGSAQDTVGNEIYSRLQKLLKNRWRLLCPFKIDDPIVQVWQYAMSAQLWEAWNLLRANEAFDNSMKKTNEVTVLAADGVRYEIPIPDGGEVAQLCVEFENLPIETRMVLSAWALKHRSFSDEFKFICMKVESLCQVCNTPGQIRRVWPELFGFMDETGKNKIFRAKANSPYPPEVMRPKFEYTDDTDWKDMVTVLRDDWTPESLEWMNMIFAQALILPIREVENYPSVR